MTLHHRDALAVEAEAWHGFGAPPRITGPGGLTPDQLDTAQAYLTQFAIYYDQYAKWNRQVQAWESNASTAQRASVQNAKAALTRYIRALNPLVPIVQRAATKARDDGALDADGRPRGSMLGMEPESLGAVSLFDDDLGQYRSVVEGLGDLDDDEGLGAFVAILWAVAAILLFAAAGVIGVYLTLPELRKFAESLPGIEREFINTRLMMNAAEADMGRTTTTRGKPPPGGTRRAPLPPTVYDQQRRRETEAQVRTASARAESGADFWQGSSAGLAVAGLAALVFLGMGRSKGKRR